MVSNCGKNEYGGISGGTAGDQTKAEFWNISWYSFGQTVIYRHSNRTVGNLISDLAMAAAENDNIGYDQPTRLTFYQQLQQAGWNPAAITTPCAADCSSATAAIVLAAGHQLANSTDETLKKLGEKIVDSVSPSDTTWDIGEDLANAGFLALRDSKYLTSDKYLLPGDINLLDSAHVYINLDTGANARTEEQDVVIITPAAAEEETTDETAVDSATETTERTFAYLHLEYGDGMTTNTDALTKHKVKWLQEGLVVNGYTIDVDGEFGRITKAAVLNFREDRGLDLADGVADEALWKELNLIEVG